MGFNKVELIQLKIVVFAPIPKASVRMAMKAYPGAFAIIRRLYRTSCQNDFIITLQGKPANRSEMFLARLRARLMEC
jgi:hypothetical protein